MQISHAKIKLPTPIHRFHYGIDAVSKYYELSFFCSLFNKNRRLSLCKYTLFLLKSNDILSTAISNSKSKDTLK